MTRLQLFGDFSDFVREQVVHSLASADQARFTVTDQHRGGSGKIKIYNVPGVDSLPLGGGASNLQAGEIFKIDRGRITAIEAMGASLPYGTKSGWGE